MTTSTPAPGGAKAIKITKAGAALLPRLPLGPWQLHGAEFSCVRGLMRQGLVEFKRDGTEWNATGRYVRTKAGGATLRAAR